MRQAGTVIPFQGRIGRASQNVPSWLLWGAGIAGLLSLLSPQPWIGLACWVALPLLAKLVWREEEPPILLYGTVYLWVNASGRVIYYGITGESMIRVFGGTEIMKATWLTLIGTIVVAIGIALALYNVPSIPWERLREEAKALSPEHLFIGYLITYGLRSVMTVHILPGGIDQFIVALLRVRWALFFLLALSVLVQRRSYRFLAVAICIEVVLGLIGFWGSFKEFFPIFVVAYFGARSISSFREITLVSAIFGVVFLIGVFWTAIKQDYRAFLTQGYGAQTVRVPVSAQAERMISLISNVEASQLRESIEPAVNRVAWVGAFAQTLEYIPEHRPFDGGDGWMRGIMHILKPRLFFPDKPPVSDAVIMERYTGHPISRGTSKAIGYFGESYADFGAWWMFLPIFFVGIGYGLMYRFFLTTGQYKIVGFALAASFLPVQIGALPSVPRLLGNGITNFVMLAALLWFAGPKLYEWARRPES